VTRRKTAEEEWADPFGTMDPHLDSYDDQPPARPSTVVPRIAKAGPKKAPAEPTPIESKDAEPWTARVHIVDPTWCTIAPPKREWFLRDSRTGAGCLPLGKVGILAGEGGVGKTDVLFQCAVAAVTGGRWLDALQVVNPGRALILPGEEDLDEARRRLYRAARSSNATMPAGQLAVIPLAGLRADMVQRDRSGNTSDAPFLVWLRGYIDEHLKLIILDPLSRFAGADAEKDNAAATAFIEAAESLATQTGATVLIGAHTSQVSRSGGKVGTTGVRGVTALTDGARWVATMSSEQHAGLDSLAADRLGETVTVTFTKSNYGRKGEPIVLRRDLNNGGTLVPLDDTDVAIIKSGAAAATEAKATRKLEAKTDAEAERVGHEDRALAEILASNPNATQRVIRAAMAEACQAFGGCGHARVDRALSRRKGDVQP